MLKCHDFQTPLVLNLQLPSLTSEVQPFVCVKVIGPSQPNGVLSSAVNLPNHTFTGRLNPLRG